MYKRLNCTRGIAYLLGIGKAIIPLLCIFILSFLALLVSDINYALAEGERSLPSPQLASPNESRTGPNDDSISGTEQTEAGTAKIEKDQPLKKFLPKVSKQHPLFGSLGQIAVDPAGNIFVEESGRIVELTEDGKLVKKWGSKGDGPGLIKYVEGLAASESHVFVADQDGVEVYTDTGIYVRTLVVGKAEDVAVSPEGLVYVADGEGAYINFYPSCKITSKAIRVYTESGDFLTSWGGIGPGNGAFGYEYITNIPVSCDVNDEYWKKYGYLHTPGHALHEAGPRSIAVYQGYVYAADYWNNRIQKFTSTGGFVASLVSGKSSYPEQLAAGQYIYVIYRDGPTEKFHSNGNYIQSALGGIDVTLDGNGNLYATGGDGDGHGLISKYSKYGGLIKKFTGYSLADLIK